MSARAAVTAAELESLKGIGDDDDIAVDVDEVNPDPHGVLDWLVKHFGDRTIERSDWLLMLNDEASSALRTAEAEKEIRSTFQRVTYTASGHHHTFTHDGIGVSTAVEFLRKTKVSIKVTKVIEVLQSLTLSEALPLSNPKVGFGRNDITNFQTAVQLLGFPGDRLTAALQAGEIRNAEGHSEHGGYLTFDALRTWVEKYNIVPTWSPSLAVRILRQRKNADNEVAATAVETAANANATAKRDADPVHQAFDIVGEWNSAEDKAAIEARQKTLAIYREVITRMKNNETVDGDVKLLAEVCASLHCRFANDGPEIQKACKESSCTHEAFDRERAVRDVALLREADELTELAKNTDAAIAEVKAAVADHAELESRYKAEIKAASERRILAWRANADANSAPGKLAELRRKNPLLFV